jgi:hypothetical protein
MSKQMLTIKLLPKDAHLAEVRRKLSLSPEDVDDDFGVVSIDPKNNLYAIMVEQAAAQKVLGKQGISGPYSNPRIETFGPPETSPAESKQRLGLATRPPKPHT